MLFVFFEFTWSGEFPFAGKLARRVDRAAGGVLITPSANGIEVLQSEANRIEYAVAGSARGIFLMQLRALAQRQALDTFFVLLIQIRNVGRWRRDTWNR